LPSRHADVMIFFVAFVAFVVAFRGRDRSGKSSLASANGCCYDAPMRRACLPAAVALLWAGPALVRPAAQEPSLELVLARASAYALNFRTELPGIAAEETYVQDVLGASALWQRRYVTHREMKSDLLLVRPDGERLVEMRDVFEADGKRVRDRDERLTRLFLEGSTSSDEQLRQILAESARYNIGNIFRNVNTPTLPLLFLEPQSLGRFTFHRTDDGRPLLDVERAKPSLDQAWVVEYQETQKGTFIRRNSSGDDLPVRGRYWIAAATGRILMAELSFQDVQMDGTIDVRYGSEIGPGFLLPVEMRERYQTRATPTQPPLETRGVATYANFRRFQVRADQTVQPPGE
jgi:hypothetical protein